MKLFLKILSGIALTLSFSVQAQPFPGPCDDVDGIKSLCNRSAPEDIVALPGGGHLLFGQYGGFGGLFLLDTASDSVKPLLPARVDSERWGEASCTEAPGENFKAHGLDLMQRADGRLQLLVVNHSGRESVEFFEVQGGHLESYRLVWRGCAEAPEQGHFNDVAGLSDGGFLVTHMGDKDAQVGNMLRYLFSMDTGFVYRWTPGEGYAVVPGTEGSLPNGIIMAPDGLSFFLNLYFDEEVRHYSFPDYRLLGSVEVEHPDNSSWTSDGRLLVASQRASLWELMGSLDTGYARPSMLPFAIVAIEPSTLAITTVLEREGPPMGAGTVAVEHDGNLYIGSYVGDRLIKVPLGVSPAMGAIDAGAVNTAMLVYNVRGYTMHEGQRVRFSALEFDKGRVTALYDSEADFSQSDASTRLDGEGATLLPGLIDSHGHIADLGQALARVNLVGSPSEADAVERAEAYAVGYPVDDWIRGHGWNQVLWPDKQFPHRSSLDAAFPDRPVALQRVDGHALWVNGRALAMAGIGADTPDPAGGKIERDADGRATGVLVDTAMQLVTRTMPAADAQDLKSSVLRALENVASLGLTSVHNAGTSAAELAALLELRQIQQLPIRVYAMLDPLDEENLSVIKAGPQLDPEEQLSVRSIKLSADGALGSRGAALYEDYSDAPGNRGLRLLSDDQLTQLSTLAMSNGYQVNIHAIGDQANGHVLDMLESLALLDAGRDSRHRIEHAQVMRPMDIERMAKLGVVASIQPTHATSDKNMAGDRLGQERLVGAYAYAAMLEQGVWVAGGSDFPVESPNPFFGLHAAVARQDHGGEPNGGWLPDQRLNRDQALSLFTENAAWAAHQDETLGRLLPGYRADFILVRDDYFEVPEAQIWRNQVLQTWVGGQKVYPIHE